MITFMPLSASSQIASSSTTALLPLAYLIQLDDIKILVDCGSPDLRRALEGGDEEGDYEKLLREHAPSISLVLLTHSSLAHLGYYPFARSHLGLTCPVYATVPVVSMGRVSCIEEVDSWRGEMDGALWEDAAQQDDATASADAIKDMIVDSDETELGGTKQGDRTAQLKSKRSKWVTTSEEVLQAFEAVTRVKYESPTRLMGTLSSLTLTAFSAGHSLGGTIWKIRSPSSGTILHAVGMNHTRERHINGTVLLKEKGEGIYEGLGRPDLLITDTDRVGWKNLKRKERDGHFLQLITSTLQSQSSLLFPVDPSTRLIELLILLDQHWSYSTAQAHQQGRNWRYPLCLVSRTGRQMVDFARSLMEWMGGSVADGEAAGDGAVGRGGRGGAGGHQMRGHPLEFRHLRFFDSVEALTSTLPTSQPKLILAIPPSMSHGPSRRLFTQLASNPNTLVLLTSRGLQGTLSQELFEIWNSKQERGSKAGEGQIGRPVELKDQMEIKLNFKVPLSGQELADHLEAKRLASEKEAAKKASRAKTSRKLLEADEVDSDASSDADSDAEVDISLGDGSGGGGDPRVPRGQGIDTGGWDDDRQVSFDIFVKGQMTRSTTFFKSAGGEKPRFRMFPVVDIRRGRKVDLYGETIDIGIWQRKGKEIEEEGESEIVKMAKRRKIEEEEKQREPPEVPSKFITETHKVQLSCGLHYIDMEGLNDGRAIKTIIPQINPRRLILVNGESDATEDLLSACKAIPSMTHEIFAPSEGEALQIGENMTSYSLSLGDGLMSALKFSKFEDYEVAQVMGRYTFPSNSTIPVLEPASLVSVADPTKPEDGETSSVATTLSLSVTLPPLAPSLYIGDLKLTALKARLQRLGIGAEFAGEGVLVCGIVEDDGDDSEGGGEVVAVRKLDKGRIEVEGGVGDLFYKVRSEVFGLHAVVSG